MPSHLLTNPTKGVYSCCSMSDLLGNDHADKLAEQQAEALDLPLNVTAPILNNMKLVTKIQHRLVTILCSLPNRTKESKLPKAKVLPTPWYNIETKHVPFEDGCRVACARCKNSFHSKDPNLKQWLSSTCIAIGTAADRPIPLPYEAIHIGNNNVHSTHSLKQYRGLIFCSKCGCRTEGAVLKKLSAPCQPPTKSYGLPAVKALRQGKRPPGMKFWPDET